MGDVIQFPQRRVTSGNRIQQVLERGRELQAAKQKQRTFRVGDTFVSEDGVSISVQDERMTERGRQLLYSTAYGKAWASDTRFIPALPEDGVA